MEKEHGTILPGRLEPSVNIHAYIKEKVKKRLHKIEHGNYGKLVCVFPADRLEFWIK